MHFIQIQSYLLLITYTIDIERVIGLSFNEPDRTENNTTGLDVRTVYMFLFKSMNAVFLVTKIDDLVRKNRCFYVLYFETYLYYRSKWIRYRLYAVKASQCVGRFVLSLWLIRHSVVTALYNKTAFTLFTDRVRSY